MSNNDLTKRQTAWLISALRKIETAALESYTKMEENDAGDEWTPEQRQAYEAALCDHENALIIGETLKAADYGLPAKTPVAGLRSKVAAFVKARRAQITGRQGGDLTEYGD